jgi:hypothetical protein
LVAMSQKVSKRYLNLKGKRKKITYRMNKMASVCHCNLRIHIRDIVTSVRRFY